MQTKSRADAWGQNSWRSIHACPECGGGLFRIPRRSFDRVVSALVPVRRFRCNWSSCHWEGNLQLTRRQAAALEAAAARINALGKRAAGPSRPRKIPKSFVVNMCLAGAGLVVVLLLTTTDLLSDPEVTTAERRKDEVLVTPQLANQGVKITRPAAGPSR